MNKKLFIGAGLLTIIALLLNFQPALAHEAITVGEYTIEVGWLSEPPVVGQQNGIELHVSRGEEPVEDISALTVTISYGGQEKLLALEPLGGDAPGQFVASLVPTAPGQYTLIFGGSLGDTAVDARVEAEEVQPASILQFPNVPNEESAPQSDAAGVLNWLTYLSLLIGLIALILGLMALRRLSSFT